MPTFSLLRFFSLAYLFFFGTLFFVPYASAHDLNYGVARTELRAEENTITLRTDLSQEIDSKPTKEVADKIILYFKEHFRISQEGTPCPFTFMDFGQPTEYQWFINGVYTCPSPVESPRDVRIESEVFADMYAILDHFVIFTAGDKEWEMLFTSENQIYPESVKAAYAGGEDENFFTVARQFIWSGLLHIWTGYDHILFLLSVILLMRSWGKILLLISSFTVAHSITLILAGLDIVTLSPRIVEPIIALSIAYMALQNILALRKGTDQTVISERWITTFGFGLIHGLGFAGALTEADIPQEYFVSSLVIFNVGIELGQLVILAIAVPLLLQVDRIRHRKTILIGASGVITLLAIFWFFERVIS